MPALTNPLPNLQAWATFFDQAQIPVLRSTATAIATMSHNEDAVSAQELGQIVVCDPLMTLKLFRRVAELRTRQQVTDVETVTSCIVMLGIGPFFSSFKVLTTVNDLFAGDPDRHHNQLRMLGVLKRIQRAADWSYEWAVRRHDLDLEVIRTATLLHDFTELLLWCFAPHLAQQIEQKLLQTPGMRSVDAQKEVLNIELNTLQHELMGRWKLPELLVRITDEHAKPDPKMHNVSLAVAMARHSANGWDNPALPDDFAALGNLLNLPVARAQAIAMGH